MKGSLGTLTPLQEELYTILLENDFKQVDQYRFQRELDTIIFHSLVSIKHLEHTLLQLKNKHLNSSDIDYMLNVAKHYIHYNQREVQDQLYHKPLLDELVNYKPKVPSEAEILKAATALIDNNTGSNLEALKVIMNPALEPNERILLVGKDMYEYLKNMKL